MKKLIYGLTVLILVSAAAFCYAQRSDETTKKAPSGESGQRSEETSGPSETNTEIKIPVLIDKVVNREQLISKKYVGAFEAIEKVTLVTRISGDIEEILFKEGDNVQKDQVLFVIDQTRYKAEVDSQRAKIEQIKAKIESYNAEILRHEAQVKYALNDYNRKYQLLKQKVGTDDETENAYSIWQAQDALLKSAKATLKGAEAELSAASANIILAEDDLKHTKIRSRINGRVGRTNFTKGNYITPSSGALVTVVQIDPIYVRFSMSEKDMLDLFKNPEGLYQESIIRLRLSNGKIYEMARRPVDGKVAFVDNEIKSHTDSIKVWVKFDNSEGSLNPGGICGVHLFKKNPEKKPAVKVSGILFDRNGHYVYVVDENNTAKRRNIKIGTSDGEYQTVLFGLKEGETIIVDGTHKVVPNSTVEPIGEKQWLEQIQKLKEANLAKEAALNKPLPKPTDLSSPKSDKKDPNVKTEFLTAPVSKAPFEPSADPAASGDPKKSASPDTSSDSTGLIPAGILSDQKTLKPVGSGSDPALLKIQNPKIGNDRPVNSESQEGPNKK